MPRAIDALRARIAEENWRRTQLIQPRYARVPTPDRPGAVTTSNRRDPRFFGVGYDDSRTMDEWQQMQTRRESYANMIPFDEATRRLDARTLPPQLNQATWTAVIAKAGAENAQLLIPKNPYRLSLVVSNPSSKTGVLFSFDFPIPCGKNAAGTNQAFGLGLPPQGYYAEGNASVSINAVYVFCNDETQTFPILIAAFEGSLSPAGNLR